MKKYIISFLLVLSALFMFGASCQIEGERYVMNDMNMRHMNRSVVALVKPKEEERQEYLIDNTLGRDHEIFCSGVFVSQSTIVTAAHCVDFQQVLVLDTPLGPMELILPDSRDPTGRQIRIATYSMYLHDAKLTTYKIFKVIRYDDEADLAVLRIEPGQSSFVHEHLSVSERTLRRGERVYALGHPVGLGWTLTEGVISAPRRIISDVSFVQCSSEVFYGNSGGAIVDEYGQLIGIVSRMYGAPHLGVHVHHIEIRKILRANWHREHRIQTVGDMVQRGHVLPH